MKFETKFNPGDEVWYMKCNKPHKQNIYRVHVEAFYSGSLKKCYPVYEFQTSGCNTERKTETDVFATKQDLIESL